MPAVGSTCPGSGATKSLNINPQSTSHYIFKHQNVIFVPFVITLRVT